MFFIAAALVLTTAGVFAGKAKFFAVTGLYLYNGSVRQTLSTGSISNLQTTQTGSATTGTITSQGNSVYTFQAYVVGTGYVPVYTSF